METETNGRADNDSVTYDIVDAIAAVVDRDPEALPPLYGSIDPDALETLATAGTVRVTFTYCGYEVTVDGDSVAVEEASPDSTAVADAAGPKADVANADPGSGVSGAVDGE